MAIKAIVTGMRRVPVGALEVSAPHSRERWHGLIEDCRYVISLLRRSRSFAVTVSLTLALGLGANAVVFSLLDSLFLRPPHAVAHPAQIRRIYRQDPPAAGATRDAITQSIRSEFAYPEFRELRAALPPNILLGGYSTSNVRLGPGDEAPQVRVSSVLGDYFAVLGIHPERGRFFSSDELRIETPAALAVVSHGLWLTQFGERKDIVGQSVELGGHARTIIGVVPDGFHGPDNDAVAAWVPLNTEYGLTPEPHWYEGANTFNIRTLATGDSPLHRQAIIYGSETVFRRGRISPDSNASAILGPLVEAAIPGSDHTEVSIAIRLAGVSLIILLIACANVTNLMLARGMDRSREVAIRQAMGITRGGLVRLFLIESLIVSLIGATVGIVVAMWGAASLRHTLLPKTRWADTPIDARILFFTFGLSMLVSVGVGLIPALRASRSDLTAGLKAGGGRTFRQSRLRTALLVAQSALSVVLLVGAGLLIRSLHSVETENIGYDADRLVFASVSWNSNRGDKSQDLLAGLPGAVERVQRINGVERVGIASTAPMQGVAVAPLFLPDRDSLPRLGGNRPMLTFVSSGFFSAAGLQVKQGRGILPEDRSGSSLVVVVNETMARTLWPGQAAVGKCVMLRSRGDPCREVVGVVSDAHFNAIIEEPSMQYYIPFEQGEVLGGETIVVRAGQGRAASVALAVRGELSKSFGNWAVLRITLMVEQLSPQLRPWRRGAALFSAAGILALLVAMIGVYSTISYTFSQRSREIGTRIALGARTTNVVRLVVVEGLRIVLVGVIIGIALSLAMSRLVASMLYRTSPHDPAVLVTVSVGLLAVAVLACIIPACRAVNVDPAATLRVE